MIHLGIEFECIIRQVSTFSKKGDGKSDVFDVLMDVLMNIERKG